MSLGPLIELMRRDHLSLFIARRLPAEPTWNDRNLWRVGEPSTLLYLCILATYPTEQIATLPCWFEPLAQFRLDLFVLSDRSAIYAQGPAPALPQGGVTETARADCRWRDPNSGFVLRSHAGCVIGVTTVAARASPATDSAFHI